MAAPKGHRPPRAGIGRPKGIPNKNTTAVKDMFRAALDEAGGKDYLLKFAKSKQQAERVAFLSAVTKLIPSEIQGKISGNVKVIIEKGEVTVHDNGVKS